MFFGYMCANVVFYGLLTWMPNYLSKVHGFDIKQMGGATFIIFLLGFVGELVGGYFSDKWKSLGGSPNKVMRTLLGFASIVVTVAVFSVAYTTGAVLTVVLRSEEHTSELQSLTNLVCRLLLEKKKKKKQEAR